MKNEIEAMITDITATTAEAEDYTGEDGLSFCPIRLFRMRYRTGQSVFSEWCSGIRCDYCGSRMILQRVLALAVA